MTLLLTRPLRANAYFKLSAASLFAEILASPLSGYLMTYSPWIPYLMSLAISIIGMLLTLAIPETLPPPAEPIGPPEMPSTRPTSKTMVEDLKQRIVAMRSTKQSWSKSSLSNRVVLVLMMTFFVTRLGKQSVFLLLQYVSKRFGWSFARVSCRPNLYPSFMTFCNTDTRNGRLLSC